MRVSLTFDLEPEDYSEKERSLGAVTKLVEEMVAGSTDWPFDYPITHPIEGATVRIVYDETLFQDKEAVYCWENAGCGKRLLRILRGVRTLDIFPDDRFYEFDSEEYDLPDDLDLTSLPIYGTYNRQENLARPIGDEPDEGPELEDTYTPVGPLLSKEQVLELFAQKPVGELYE